MEDDIKSEAQNLRLKAEELLGKTSLRNAPPLPDVETLKLIHELEVHQIELEMQRDELVMANTASTDMAGRYTDLFNFSSSGYIILSKEGEIIDLNHSGAKLLGKKRFELKNSRFVFFVADDYRTIYNNFLENTFNNKAKITCEVLLIPTIADTIVVQLTGILTQDEQQCFMTVKDITEIRQREKYLEMTREILQILNEPGTIKDAIHNTLTVLKTYTGFDAVGIRLKDNNDYPYLDQTGLSNEFLLSENTLLEFDKHGKVCRDKNGNPRLGCTCGLVISGKADQSSPYFTAGGSWWTNNSFPILDIPAKDDVRFRPRNICMHEGYASVALVPIRNNAMIVGLIQFNDKRKDRFNLNTLEVLEGIASHIGAAIMRKQAEESLQRNEELLRNITENAPDIIVELDRDGTILYMSRVLPGYRMEDIIGKNFVEWTLPECHAEMLKTLELVFSTGTNQSFDSRGYGADKEIRWYKSSLAPVNTNGIVKYAVMVVRDITDNIKAAEKLQQSEERYKSLFQNNHSVMMLLNPETGEIIDANPTACNFYGWSLSEMCSKNISDINTLSKEEVTVEMQNAKEEQRNHFFFKHRLATNEIRDVEVFSGPIRFGETTMLYSLVHDITDRKKAGEALQQSEERYKSLFQGNQSIMLLLDPESGQIKDANPAACLYYGWTHDELCAKNITEINPNPKEESIQDLQRSKNNKNNHLFLNHRLANGEMRDVEVYSSPILFEGSILVYAIINDITESKQDKEELQKSKDNLRAILDATKESIFVFDRNGIIVNANDTAAQRLNKSLQDIVGNHLREFIPAELASTRWEQIMKVFDSGNQIKNEDQRLDYIFENNYFPIFENDRVKNVVIFSRDISEQRKNELALQESEKRLKYHFENSPLAVVEWDTDFVVTQWSAEAERIFGWTKEETIGKPIGELNLIYEEDLPIVNHTMQRLTSGEEDTVVSSNRNITKSGTIIITVWYNSILFDEKGAMKSVMSLVQDITAQKQAEEALVESEYLFRESQRAAFIGSYKTNFKTGMWESSEVMDQIFGIDNTYVKSVDGWLHLIHPDDRDLMNQYLSEEVLGKELPFNKEYRIIRQNDGEVRWIHGLGKIEFDDNGTITALVGTIQDITERKAKEEALRKLNKTLSALSKSSQIMAQSTDEAEYLNKVCDIVVEDTDFAMVWIGYAEDDEEKTIRPVARAGFNDDYLDLIKISWADNEFGRGPSGVAVRTGKMAMCNNMFTDPNFKPWREQALKRGYSASIVFPLKSGDTVFGAFTIYAKEPDAFLEDEIKLLSKLASDLAHGIITLRLRKAHELAEEALRQSHDNLEIQVKERTAELVKSNEVIKMAEEKYRTVADFTYNMETWIDKTGNYIYVSPSCQNVTGYSSVEFMKDPKLMINIAHPDDKKIVEEHFEEKIKGNLHSCNLDFRIITKEGKERWIGHSCQSVYNSNGEWIGQRGSNRNINKQKNAELVLIESEKHLRALTQRIDEVAEEERIRISREIHDEIGHLLTALKYDTESLINHSSLSPEQIKEELSGMISMIEALIDSVRKIATDLRPGILDHMGLLAALEWKIKQFRLKNKICCEYTIEEMDVQFTKNETTFIYRILQEIFTNVTRHSKATNIWISITKGENLFIMKISDNGIGFDYQESLQKGSLGLLGMVERAKSIGGEVQIESEFGKGTTTTFILKK